MLVVLNSIHYEKQDAHSILVDVPFKPFVYPVPMDFPFVEEQRWRVEILFDGTLVGWTQKHKAWFHDHLDEVEILHQTSEGIVASLDIPIRNRGYFELRDDQGKVLGCSEYGRVPCMALPNCSYAELNWSLTEDGKIREPFPEVPDVSRFFPLVRLRG